MQAYHNDNSTFIAAVDTAQASKRKKTRKIIDYLIAELAFFWGVQ